MASRQISILKPLFFAFLLVFFHGASAATVNYIDLAVNFTRTDFKVRDRHSFDRLLRAHYRGNYLQSYTLDSFEGLETRTLLTGNTRNHSIMMAASFDLSAQQRLLFEVGADWGRGGGVAVFNNDTNTLLESQVISDDIWWNNDWNNSDVISTDVTLSAGSWSIIWLGFENCCSGSNSIRFSTDGEDYTAFSTESFIDRVNTPGGIVPLPGSAMLFMSSIAGLMIIGKKRANSEGTA